MLTITGGNATITRANGLLKASGTVTLRNDGKNAAQVLRMATENHAIVASEPVGSSGGGMSRFGALGPKEERAIPFAVTVGSPAIGGADPLRVLVHIGLRIEYTEDDGETIEDVNLWASASGILVDGAMEKPVNKINRPTGELYDIAFDVG